MSIAIRPLVPDDAPQYTALRIEMLKESPTSFGASLDTDVASTVEGARGRLSSPLPSRMWGAFEEGSGALVGVVGGGKQGAHHKRAHVYAVWGMYVQPKFRGVGISKALMGELLAFARGLDGVISVYLSVSETAAAAQALYASLGFQVWGCEPRSLQYEGEYFDEIYMLMDLRTA